MKTDERTEAALKRGVDDLQSRSEYALRPSACSQIRAATVRSLHSHALQCNRKGNAMTLESILAKLSRVRREGNEWKALCPAHADKNPSLSTPSGTVPCFLVPHI
jgi:CHC2 zinc finger